ncbi:VOC family protein [Kaistella sp. BT6-1-3]|uniref:VOC family protein n=1 Tax=Kaistella yananensis TaxID=2989820 RepID=A0ABT3JKP2_9FLAO|nr:VOC family protein [Kaistella yananensis]MCW4451351.1 VOC family protein [Kaistella yananensis]
MKIHHIAIICSDYQVSKKFYTEILGLQILREVYRAERDSYKLDLGVGEHYVIELFSFPNPPARPSRPESCGLRHLAFSVENLEEKRDELMKKGLVCEEIRVDEFTDRKFFFTQDPDALPLEFYEA